jgi:hypothetical protein
MCPAPGLPVALVPLWQPAQLPTAATVVWLKVVGFQAVMRWQPSHCAVVAMWVAGLTSMPAKLPPWQLAHEPAATPAWPYVAGTGNQALVDV